MPNDFAGLEHETEHARPHAAQVPDLIEELPIPPREIQSPRPLDPFQSLRQDFMRTIQCHPRRQDLPEDFPRLDIFEAPSKRNR